MTNYYLFCVILWTVQYVNTKPALNMDCDECRCGKYQKLYTADCRQEIIHITLTSVPRIVNDNTGRIDMTGQPLRHLPENTVNGDRLPELLELIFQYCDIERINKHAFQNLPNLKKLDLSHNNMKTLHEGTFEETPNLTKLLLNNNYLTHLPSHLLQHLKHIMEINFRSNWIHSIGADTFPNIPGYVLDLSENKLQEFNIHKVGIKQKVHIYLINNLFRYDCSTKRMKNEIKKYTLNVESINCPSDISCEVSDRSKANRKSIEFSLMFIAICNIVCICLYLS